MKFILPGNFDSLEKGDSALRTRRDTLFCRCNYMILVRMNTNVQVKMLQLITLEKLR